MSKSEVRFCPQCGGAGVDFSQLAGGSASCRTCKWEGLVEALLIVPITHEFISDESMLIGMMNDLRKLLSNELGLPYLKFLLKWGFLSANLQQVANTLDRKKFSRYIAAIARGVLLSVIEERAKIAAEQAS